MSAVLETTRFGSGKEVQRVEDPALLAGKGQFWKWRGSFGFDQRPSGGPQLHEITSAP